MDAIFRNSENCKSSNSHKSLLNFTYKIYIRRGQKCVALSNIKYKSPMKKQ